MTGTMGRVILLTCLALGLARIAQAADEPTLEERVAAIDRVVAQPDGMRVVLGHISRELHVSAEDLRTQGAQTGLGLGEILVANRLAADRGSVSSRSSASSGAGGAGRRSQPTTPWTWPR